VQYSVLGPLEVRDGERRLDIPGRAKRGLLGLLIVEAGTTVSVDRMIYELWGDDPPRSAKRTLRSHVSRVRGALGPDVPLVTRPPGYVLDAAFDQIDANVFESLTERARYELASDARAAAATAIEALGMWRGDALADLAGFPYADAEARRLEELRLGALEVHLDAEVRAGRHAEVLHELRAAATSYPFYERFWALLMLALYRTDRSGDALRTFEEARKALGESLGIEPSADLRMLERSIVMEDPSLDIETALPPHNLPSVSTSFVGREQELDALADLLARSRIVTLVGAGGCGKSRLAVETAARVLQRFPHGVWHTELAPIHDPAMVASAVIAALGDPASHATDPMESLVAYLKDKKVLLVIDNCEHLLDVCVPLIDAVVAACPEVTVLATSREPLRMAGERVVLVPPLGLPDPVEAIADQENSEAFRLFVERTREAGGRSPTTDEERKAITGVCRAVAGLPLAIELAAARTRTLDVRRLVGRMDAELDVLTGAPRTALDRHRTMRSAIAWSHRLLTSEEQATFRRLAVFRGGWTLEAATAVIGPIGGNPADDLVAGLVDRSLVERHGEQRYRLLEPIRQFAAELLAGSEDAEEVRHRHFAYYLEFARRADAAIRGAGQIRWWRELDADHDNVRAALRRALDDGRVADALRLVAAMGWYWFTRGHWRESWIWFDEARRAAGPVHSAELAEAVYRTASAEIVRVNHEPVLTYLREALADCRRRGDRVGETWCLHFVGLGGLQLGTHRLVDGEQHPLQTAHRMFTELGDPWAVAWSERYLGDLLADAGDVDGGVDHYLRSVAGFSDLGDRWSVAHSLDNLAKLLAYFGTPSDFERARGYFRRALREAQTIGDPVWTAHGMLGVAWGDHVAGNTGAVPMLADACERLRLIGDENCLSNASAWLGEALAASGAVGDAAALLEEAIVLACKLGHPLKIAINLDRAARLAMHHGDTRDAARLVAAVERALDAGTVNLLRRYADEHQTLVTEVGWLPDDPLDLDAAVPLALDVVRRLSAESDGERLVDQARPAGLLPRAR